MAGVESGRGWQSSQRLKADVVVVGTGAGGGMAAFELAKRGLRVLALEHGSALPVQAMTQREDQMLPRLYAADGTLLTEDYAIRVMAGRAVGGSTAHNICLCKRAPDEVLLDWGATRGVSGVSPEALAPVYESVEQELSVTEIPAAQRNANNRALERGLARLGWRGGPLRHNRVGCAESGFCEIGCPFNAKQNSAKVLLPKALELGARVIADVRVERVLHEGGRVRGVRGVAVGAAGERLAEVEVEAAAVVLSGGALGSAVLGLQSGLPDPHRRLGRGLRLHPGIAVAGLFDEEIEAWKGIPQSYECTEWLDFSPESERRVWITTVFAHPIAAAILMPGFGAEHARWMARYSRLAALTAMVHDESDGVVTARSDGLPRIDYRSSERDLEQLALGLRRASELLFAAGAREVLVPTVTRRVLTAPSEVETLGLSAVQPNEMPMTAVHPMGTLAMGDDPRRAVVRSTGEHHQVAGLFALDGSLFPTSLGVPPQLSIYAFARYLAPNVVTRLAG